MNNAIPPSNVNIITGVDGRIHSGLLACQYQIPNILNYTPDAYYRDELIYKKAFKGGGMPSSIPIDIAKLNLDITRISNRIIVMGGIWNHKTNKQLFKNNIDEVALFLNSRYGKKYMIWNLGSSDMKYNISPFRNQVVNFQLSKLLTFSIKSLFNICRTLFGWMDLDEGHVAIIHCKNGKSRTGLIVACFLRYLELFDTTYESLEYFISKRTPNESDWVTITLRRYLRYFNDIIILNGRVPNTMPLRLHQILINTIPNFDGQGSCDPGVEIYQNGKLTYSSIIREMELNLSDSNFSHSSHKHHKNPNFNSSSSSFPLIDEDSEAVYDDEELLKDFQIRMALQDEKPQKNKDSLILKDAHHIVFRLDNVVLHGDVQVRLYHQNIQSRHHNTTILNLAFNTSFMAPGLIRLKLADLETPLIKIPPPGSGFTVEQKSRFNSEFALDLVATVVDGSSKLISYESATMKCRAKDLLKLSQFHSVRADPVLIKPLELQGYHKFFARLGLQLRNNDIHLAHEFLSLLKSNIIYYESIDKELVMLGKIKYEKIKGISMMPSSIETERRKSLESKTTNNFKNEIKTLDEHSIPIKLKEQSNQSSIVKFENFKGKSSIDADNFSVEKGDSNINSHPHLHHSLDHGQQQQQKHRQPPRPKLSFLDQIKGISKNIEEIRNESYENEIDDKRENIPILTFEKETKRNDYDDTHSITEALSSSFSISKESNFIQGEESCAEGVGSFIPNSSFVSPPPPLPPPFPFSKGKKEKSINLDMETDKLQKDFTRVNIKDEKLPLSLPIPPPPPLAFLKKAVSKEGEYNKKSNAMESETILPIPPPPPPSLSLLSKSRESKSSEIKRTESIDSFHSGISDDQNRFKIKHRLNWSEIKDKHKIRNSVWIELMEQYPEYDVDSLDVHKFEELFCVDMEEKPFQSKNIVSKSSSRENSSTARILELKRANNIGIGLSRFYKRMNDTEILEYIVNIDERLSLDDLLTLRNIIPIEEERQLLDLFKGSKDSLIRSEQFSLEMVREPNLTWMTDALIYIRQFNGEYENLSEKLIIIIGLLTKLRESPDLKIILKGALEVGNLASYDYARLSAHSRARGKALGFTMDSLTKLHEVKSIDRKTNLLDYVATGLIGKYPGLILLPQEFTDLAAAKHWDSFLIESNYLDLDRTLDKLKNEKISLIKDGKGSQIGIFRENLTAHLESINIKLQELNFLLNNMKSLWNRTAEYFGESSEEMKTEELFAIFDQFFKYFSLAIQNCNRESDKQQHQPHSTTATTTLSRTSSQDSFITFNPTANATSNNFISKLTFDNSKSQSSTQSTSIITTIEKDGLNNESENIVNYSEIVSINNDSKLTKFVQSYSDSEIENDSSSGSNSLSSSDSNSKSGNVSTGSEKSIDIQEIYSSKEELQRFELDLFSRKHQSLQGNSTDTLDISNLENGTRINNINVPDIESPNVFTKAIDQSQEVMIGIFEMIYCTGMALGKNKKAKICKEMIQIVDGSVFLRRVNDHTVIIAYRPIFNVSNANPFEFLSGLYNRTMELWKTGIKNVVRKHEMDQQIHIGFGTGGTMANLMVNYIMTCDDFRIAALNNGKNSLNQINLITVDELPILTKIGIKNFKIQKENYLRYLSDELTSILDLCLIKNYTHDWIKENNNSDNGEILVKVHGRSFSFPESFKNLISKSQFDKYKNVSLTSNKFNKKTIENFIPTNLKNSKFLYSNIKMKNKLKKFLEKNNNTLIKYYKILSSDYVDQKSLFFKNSALRTAKLLKNELKKYIYVGKDVNCRVSKSAKSESGMKFIIVCNIGKHKVAEFNCLRGKLGDKEENCAKLIADSDRYDEQHRWVPCIKTLFSTRKYRELMNVYDEQAKLDCKFIPDSLFIADDEISGSFIRSTFYAGDYEQLYENSVDIFASLIGKNMKFPKDECSSILKPIVKNSSEYNKIQKLASTYTRDMSKMVSKARINRIRRFKPMEMETDDFELMEFHMFPKNLPILNYNSLKLCTSGETETFGDGSLVINCNIKFNQWISGACPSICRKSLKKSEIQKICTNIIPCNKLKAYISLQEGNVMENYVFGMSLKDTSSTLMKYNQKHYLHLIKVKSNQGYGFMNMYKQFGLHILLKNRNGMKRINQRYNQRRIEFKKRNKSRSRSSSISIDSISSTDSSKSPIEFEKREMKNESKKKNEKKKSKSRSPKASSKSKSPRISKSKSPKASSKSRSPIIINEILKRPSPPITANTKDSGKEIQVEDDSIKSKPDSVVDNPTASISE